MSSTASQQKPSKIDMKRMQARVEKRKRLLNEGVPADKVDLVLAREEYKALSPDSKIERMQTILSGSFEQLQQNLSALHHNDQVLSGSLTVNFRAMAKCLELLGISKEKQQELLKQADEEFVEEQKKIAESRAVAAVEQHSASEKAQAEAILKEAETPKIEVSGADAVESEPLPIPEGATTFGD